MYFSLSLYVVVMVNAKMLILAIASSFRILWKLKCIDNMTAFFFFHSSSLHAGEQLLWKYDTKSTIRFINCKQCTTATLRPWRDVMEMNHRDEIRITAGARQFSRHTQCSTCAEQVATSPLSRLHPSAVVTQISLWVGVYITFIRNVNKSWD